MSLGTRSYVMAVTAGSAGSGYSYFKKEEAIAWKNSCGTIYT